MLCTIISESDNLTTRQIQEIIDKSSENKGKIIFKQGKYIIGKLNLKSDTHIIIEPEVQIIGSENYLDYGDGSWKDSLFSAFNAQNISISGGGVIDGADCKNENGEEGFRGPHIIYFNNCENINIEELTIKRSANYAIFNEDCTNGNIKNVTVLGGHDGIHLQRCTDYNVNMCNLYTGDDCIAGCDNKQISITNCKLNSSCNGLRFGGDSVLVSDCEFWGPGEYQHRVSGRKNMLCAFIYFSPIDRNPTICGDNIVIKNIKVHNIECIFEYQYKQQIWQDGLPLKKLVIENVVAKDVVYSIQIRGNSDDENTADVTLKNIDIEFENIRLVNQIINISNVYKLEINDFKVK